jgi:hypothetical protein
VFNPPVQNRTDWPVGIAFTSRHGVMEGTILASTTTPPGGGRNSGNTDIVRHLGPCLRTHARAHFLQQWKLMVHQKCSSGNDACKQDLLSEQQASYCARAALALTLMPMVLSWVLGIFAPWGWLIADGRWEAKRTSSHDPTRVPIL